MGKRCACDRAFRRIEEDTQLRTLPLAAKMLWLQLARLAASTPGFTGVLQFGSDFGFLTSVAMSVTCAETEVEPNLAALERRGLVRRGEDGTSLILSQVEPTSARAEAARINGLQGGRRRKGETLDERRERRQRELMLPIAGGAAETQAEPKGETSRTRGTSTSTYESIDSGTVGTAREEADWVSLGHEVAAACGFEPRAGIKGFEPVRVWLRAGADPELILRVVRDRMDRRPPPHVSNLHYFTKAIEEAIAGGGSATRRETHAPAVPREPAKPSAFERALRDWLANGAQGVPPRIEDVRAA